MTIVISAYPRTDVSLGLAPEHPEHEHWYHLIVGEYLHGSSDAGYTDDWYTFDRLQANGPITNITLKIIACSTPTAGKHAIVSFRASRTGTIYNLHTFTLSADWTEHTFDISVNPATGMAWTWGDFDVGEFALSLDHTTAYCVRFGVDITFAQTPGTMYIGSGVWRTKYFVFDGDTINFVGDWIRNADNRGPVVVATPGSIVTGAGSISGGWGPDPVIYTIGSVQIKGVSPTQPLTIKNNLYHGAQINDPSNCLIQDVNFEDCRSGTSTVPVIGDASSGMGLWLRGAGTGNVLRRLTATRCGIHGIQVYGSDNNVLDYIDVDGVYGYFGLSLYQTDGTTASNVTTANTRREGVNLMQCTGSSLTDFAVRNGQTDYGVSDYLCDGSTIQRGTIDRTHKDGLAIVGSDNGQYDHVIITKACQGRYIGHYAGIMLEGSDSVGCENNIVEWCTIEDLDHRQIFNIKEVAYIPSGTNLTNSNIIRNNRCYGAIRGPVRTVGSLSTQSNNGVIEIV